MSELNLVLHCGAEQVELDDPVMVKEPASLGTHHAPIPHREYVDLVKGALANHGFAISQEVYGALKDGSRFFGLMEIDAREHEDWNTVFGLRASHDQSFKAALSGGFGVFVCDNLSFTGEAEFGTKQTTYLRQRLPDLVSRVVAKVYDVTEHQAERIEHYKDVALTDTSADAAITEMIRRNVITASSAKRVIEHWDEPEHAEFAAKRNVWRLYNAVTETYKPRGEHTNMAILPARSLRLTHMCDELANVA